MSNSSSKIIFPRHSMQMTTKKSDQRDNAEKSPDTPKKINGHHNKIFKQQNKKTINLKNILSPVNKRKSNEITLLNPFAKNASP